MVEIYNKIKNEKIIRASSEDNILYIFTDKEDYKLNINFLKDYEVFASVSRYRDPIWGIREKAS